MFTGATSASASPAIKPFGDTPVAAMPDLNDFDSLDQMTEEQQGLFLEWIGSASDKNSEQEAKAAEIIRNSTLVVRDAFLERVKTTSTWQQRLSRSFNKRLFPNSYALQILNLLPSSVDAMSPEEQLELARLIKDGKCSAEKLNQIFAQSTYVGLFNFFANLNAQERLVKGVMRGDITDPRILDGLKGTRVSLSQNVQKQLWNENGQQMMVAMMASSLPHESSSLFLFKFFPDLTNSEQEKIANSVFYEWLPRNASTLHTLDEHLKDFPLKLKNGIKNVVINAIVAKILGDGSNPQQILNNLIEFRKLSNEQFAGEVGIAVIRSLASSSRCLLDSGVQFLIARTISCKPVSNDFLMNVAQNLPDHVTDQKVLEILRNEHFQAKFFQYGAQDALEILKQKLLPPKALVVRDRNLPDLYPDIDDENDVAAPGEDVVDDQAIHVQSDGDVVADQTTHVQSDPQTSFAIFPMPVNELLVYLGMVVAGVVVGGIAWNMYQQGSIRA